MIDPNPESALAIRSMSQTKGCYAATPSRKRKSHGSEVEVGVTCFPDQYKSGR